MTQPPFRDGAPCWADLSTPDLAGAHRFYGRLFGWTFDEPNPTLGGYGSCRIDGKAVAGIMPFLGGQSVSAWTVYLQSPDIEATARAIGEHGGTLISPAYDVMGLGKMMIASDPTGAVVGVWQPGKHRGAELFDVPGAMCWHEIHTRDGAAADRFYAAVFASEQRRMDGGACHEYTMYIRDGLEVAARVQMTAAWGDAPPHWLTYFSVADVDATLAKLAALEGKQLHAPMDTPYGRFATVQDPYGAVFAVVQRTAHNSDTAV